MAIPIEYGRFQSPESYQNALGDVNAQWLLKVLKGAPGAVRPDERTLIEKLRTQYATPGGGLNLPSDILDVIRKSASGGPATSDAERMSAVQMPSWNPVGGVTGGAAAPTGVPMGTTPSIRKYVSAKDAFAQMRANPNMPTPALGVSPLTNPVKKYQSPTKIPTQATPIATSPFRPDWMNQANELLGSGNMYSSTPVIHGSTPETNSQTGIAAKGDKTITGFLGQTNLSTTGNNIAASNAIPTTSVSDMAAKSDNPTEDFFLGQTNLSPNAGTITGGSLVNPINNRRKHGANKYFNRQWFGGKALA